MQAVFYAHGGSKNHGCEAIIRATHLLLQQGFERQILLSYNSTEDVQYGLDQLLEVRQEVNPIDRKSTAFLLAFLKQKLAGNYHMMDALMHKKAIQSLPPIDWAFFVGGDNYCYSDVKNYMPINSYMRRKAKNTILWGTSVDPVLLMDRNIAEDIQKFTKIVARESISYEALKRVNPNTILLPDPAFYLPVERVRLPEGFQPGRTIGINLSPLILDYASSSGKVLANYERLIDFILQDGESTVALIPHVVWKSNDDREPMKLLLKKYSDSRRIFLVQDYNCMQQKYIISQCRFFVGARTHATIAAYSTGVPTLAIGYSVKARGIARDLFSSEENYVLPVQRLQREDEIVKAYQWLREQELDIKRVLDIRAKERERLVPEYMGLIINE